MLSEASLLLATVLCAQTSPGPSNTFQQAPGYLLPAPGPGSASWYQPQTATPSTSPPGGWPQAFANAATGQAPASSAQGTQRSASEGFAAAPLSGTAPAETARLSKENLITFDPAQLEVQWSNGHFLLKSGDVYLKEFRQEREAEEAKRIISELHLTQLGRVGAPMPVMEYWLSDGHAPHAESLARHPLSLESDSLRVEQVNGQWYLRNRTRSLFSFGAHEDQARQALDVIRHYGFTQVSYLGQSSPTMLVFLGLPWPGASQSLAKPAPLVSRSRTPGHPLPESPLASGAPQGGVLPTAFTQAPPTNNPTATMLNQGLTTDSGQAAAAAALAATAVTPTLSSSQPLLPASSRPRVAVSELNAAADRVPFDWRQVQVHQDGRNWLLVSGSTQLMNFGGNEQDARLALSALQHYHFTEHDMIGHPQPVFSYYLSEGQAPRGVMPGVDSVAFKPAALVVRKMNDNWSLCEGQQVLLSFGNRGDQAWAAKGIIDRYHFDRLCHIGHEGAGMTFLVSSR